MNLQLSRSSARHVGHAFVWSSIKHQSSLRRQEIMLITHNTCGFVGRDEPEVAMTTDPRRSRIGTCAAVHRTRSLDLSPPPHKPLRAVVSIGAADRNPAASVERAYVRVREGRGRAPAHARTHIHVRTDATATPRDPPAPSPESMHDDMHWVSHRWPKRINATRRTRANAAGLVGKLGWWARSHIC